MIIKCNVDEIWFNVRFMKTFFLLAIVNSYECIKIKMPNPGSLEKENIYET